MRRGFSAGKPQRRDGKKRRRAAVKIQRWWIAVVAVRDARRVLLTVRQNRAAQDIQRTWRKFVDRAGRVASSEFSQWLVHRRQRLLCACYALVRVGAVRRRWAAGVIGRQARVKLLSLRRRALFLRVNAHRIQRAVRQYWHWRATAEVCLTAQALLLELRAEAKQRALLLRACDVEREYLVQCRTAPRPMLRRFAPGTMKTPSQPTPPRRYNEHPGRPFVQFGVAPRVH